MRETLEEAVARTNRYAFVLGGDDPTANTGARKMPSKVKLTKGKEFTFSAAKAGGEAKYDWDGWFSGELLLIERSEGPENSKGTIEDGTEIVKRDYGVPTNGMVPKLHTAARRRYKVVQISRTDFDGKKIKGGLIIRARDMDAAERVEEDILRAEEKQAKADKVAADKVAADKVAADKVAATSNGHTHTPAPTALPVA